MQTKINGEKEDLSAMLIGAERYALGRKTYIVQWTCEFIGNNLHLLTEKDRQVMIRDIENPISYGDECDKVCWMQLLEKLRKENITNEKAKSRKSRKEKQYIQVRKDGTDSYGYIEALDTLVKALKMYIK